jgi:4-amino-4-deoxy-L-arabinose transferase-like glycosyltransferase
MKKRITSYLKFSVIVFIISFPIFGNLNVWPVRIWDESRLAVNAYQMYQDHDWIVTHYWDNSPDMWNTKPPLLIWCQVLCMKIMGIGELAIRIPSAIAAFLTCLSLLILSIRYLKDFMFGFIAVMVLITSLGYINVHATRTGDYDSLLTLFTTVSAFSFFAYSENRNVKYLYSFFLSLAFGVLTKGITILMFVPAFIIYALWQKQLVSLFKNKHFYFGALLFLSIALGYYFLREHYNPGYIRAVSANELGGRYLNDLIGYNPGFWFYYNNMLDEHLTAWYLVIPCGILIGVFSANKKIQKLTVFSIVLIVIFFLIISTAKTKLNWYDCPLFPFIAIIVTVFIHFIFSSFENASIKSNFPALKYNIIPYVFLFLVFINPYQTIISKTYYSKEHPYNEEVYQISYFMRNAIHNPQKVDNCYLMMDEAKDQLFLYLKVLQNKGVHIAFKKREELQAGDTIIACEQSVKEYIAANYNYQNIENYKNISKYRLISHNAQNDLTIK